MTSTIITKLKAKFELAAHTLIAIHAKILEQFEIISGSLDKMYKLSLQLSKISVAVIKPHSAIETKVHPCP